MRETAIFPLIFTIGVFMSVPISLKQKWDYESAYIPTDVNRFFLFPAICCIYGADKKVTCRALQLDARRRIAAVVLGFNYETHNYWPLA